MNEFKMFKEQDERRDHLALWPVIEKSRTHTVIINHPTVCFAPAAYQKLISSDLTLVLSFEITKSVSKALSQTWLL